VENLQWNTKERLAYLSSPWKFLLENTSQKDFWIAHVASLGICTVKIHRRLDLRPPTMTLGHRRARYRAPAMTSTCGYAWKFNSKAIFYQQKENFDPWKVERDKNYLFSRDHSSNDQPCLPQSTVETWGKMGVFGTKFGWSNNEIVKRSFYPFLLLYYFFIFIFILFYIFHLNPNVLTTFKCLFFADKKSRSEVLNKETPFCFVFIHLLPKQILLGFFKKNFELSFCYFSCS